MRQKTSSEVSKMLVTPSQAQHWLTNNSRKNRDIKHATVRRYSEEMRQKNWIETTDTIKFDTQGYLIDGQHRLMAIVQSGVTLPFYIATHLPEKTIEYLDLNAPRTVKDIARVQGKAYHRDHFVCAKNMLSFSKINTRNISEHALIAFVDDYIDVITFAIKRYETKVNPSMRSGQVNGTVGRAYLWGADKERLDEFKQVFSTGIPIKGEADYAALCLRNKITDMTGQAKILNHYGSSLQNMKFEYVQTALSNFLNYRKVTTLRGTSKNLFPVSELDNLYNYRC